MDKNSPVIGQSDTGLYSMLAEYGAGSIYPMHMPGHKRNSEMLRGMFPWQLDITELDGFDDLHNAEGILAEGMTMAAELYGSKYAFYLVNGSTCGLLAGIRACTYYGDKVLVARNCHMAVYHAIELCGLRPVYITPPFDEAFGIYGSITPKSIADALRLEPECVLAIITSPTYEGVVSDVRSIAGLLHRHGIPLLVDEAHGAHLGLSQYFPDSAVNEGADIVIQSLHKTLPSLTQTAIAHVCGDIIHHDNMKRQLKIFETSSPSYVLMASIDQCVRMMQAQGKALLCAYKERLDRFSMRMQSLNTLRVLCHGFDSIDMHPVFFAFDMGKLVISTARCTLTASSLMEILQREYNIQLEMAMGDYALAMTSICDTDEGIERLANALLAIDQSCAAMELNPAKRIELPAMPPQTLLIHEAMKRTGEVISFSESVGRVSQEYVWAYPPGIPLLTPGQRIDAALVRAIHDMRMRQVRIRGTRGEMPTKIAVISL